MSAPRPYVLAGGIVEESGGSGAVCAFVAVHAGLSGSRLFTVSGSVASPIIAELPPETTVNLARFKKDIEEALRPTVDAITARGGVAKIAQPKAEWLSKLVLEHLARLGG